MRYIILALLLMLSGVGYLLHQEIEAHGKTKANLELATTTVDTIKKAMADIAVNHEIVSGKNLAANLELKQIKRELDNLRGRESAYISKPRLVEKLINKDFNKDQKELACLTGDTKLCH